MKTTLAERRSRFRDEAAYPSDFLDEVWVLCPSCERPGRVCSGKPYWRAEPRFSCGHCAMALRGRHTRWFGPSRGVARRRCGRCGRNLYRELSGSVGVIREIDLTCPGCSATSIASVVWSFDTRNLPYEPSFGLRLQFQASCRGHTLWAFNPRHLRFLREFVSADVRERIPNRNATLASRLPAWLKEGKNRRAILKAIASMERRALRS